MPSTSPRNLALRAAALAVACTFVLGAAAHAASYNINASEDTWLDPSAPNTTEGTNVRLLVDGTLQHIALAKYDVSSIPSGETVTSAQALFYVQLGDASATPIRVFRPMIDWSEGTATWNNTGAYIDSTTTWGTFTAPTNGVWVSVDVTSLVQSWRAGVSNFGLALAGQDAGDAVRLHSQNGTSQPYLSVTTSSTLALADLAVSKSVNIAAPAVGDSVQFSVSVTNTTLFGTTGVVVHDPLPLGLTYVASGLSQGSYNYKTGVWTVGSIGLGGSAALNVIARVDSTAGGRTITNWAWYADTSGQDGNPSNDADSASVVVPIVSGADVALALGVDDPAPSPGQDLTYTVDLTNGGPDTATTVKVAVTLAAGLTAGLGTPDIGTWDGGTGIWTVPSLAMGAAAQLVLAATVDLGTGGDTLTVSTSIDGLDQNDPAGDNDKASVDVTVQSADLAVVTSVDDAAPSEGGTVTFTTLLSNRGPTGATGVSLVDSLPAGLTYVGHAVSAGSYDQPSGTWTVGALAPSSVDSLVVTATVDAGTIGNTMTYAVGVGSSDQQDPDPANDSDSASLTVPGADLRVVQMTVDQANPAEGDTIRFTVALRNAGPSDATGVALDDVLPAGLTYVNDNASQGSYDSATGRWTVGALGAGATQTLTLDASVDPGTAGGTITNTAAVAASSLGDPDPSNDSASVDVTVQSADLQVTNTASNPVPNEGSNVIFTVTVRNLGPNAANGVAVTDLLPAGLTYVSDTPSTGAYNDGSGLWNVGNMASGAIETIAILATVDAGTGGTVLTTTASGTLASPPDPNGANDSADASVDVQAADLTLSKTVNTPLPSPGSTITYTIDVVNAGPDPATSVAVADTLRSGVTYLSSLASQGSYSPLTHLWTIGTVASADTVTLALLATVNAGTAGQKIWNHATVAAVDQADPAPGGETDSVSINVNSVVPIESADLVVAKTVDTPAPGEGDTITYDIIVSNSGPDPAGSVKITDQLPAGVTFAGSSATTGSYASGSGLWTVGALAVAQAETLTVTATVDGGTAGQTITNTASVSGSSVPDLNPLNSSDSVPVTVRDADLALSMTVDDAKPNEGDTVTFTVLAVNLGPDATTGVQITDHLPAGLSFASATPSAGTYASGTGAWDIGAMAVGDSVTLGLSATVDAATGGTTITNDAVLTGSDEGDSTPGDDSASAGVTVRLANLGVLLAVDDAAPAEGDPVTFTVSLANAGPDSATGAVVTDLLPAGLTFASAVAGQGSYDDATGVWTIGAVAPDDTLSLAVTATVDAGTNGTTIWDHAAITASDVADHDAANDADSVRVDVPLILGVTVAMSQTPATKRPGATAVGFATVSLANSTAATRTLTSLAFDNVTTGPGSTNERDQEFGTLTLYRDDGDFVFEPLRDTPLGQATFSGGRVIFTGLSVSLPSSAVLGLHLGGAVSLLARDGDGLDVEIGGPADVVFDAAPTFRNTWPVAAAGAITVDGMVAAQIPVSSGRDGAVIAGGDPAVAWDGRVPTNGYTADTLQEIRFRNLGTASPGGDYTVKVWKDGGDGLYDGGVDDDTFLGSAVHTGPSWELTGLAELVPNGGLRLFATVTAPLAATADATIRLVIPTAGPGIVVLSGNDGPLDAASAASGTLTITPAPTPIDVAIAEQSGVTAIPGAAAMTVFGVRLRNDGTRSETLSSVTFTNRATGSDSASVADLDADWTSLELVDARNLDAGTAGTARLAGATFSGGSVTFPALALAIAAGDSVELLVRGNASLAARDGDRLDLRIEDATAFQFGRTVEMNGTFPADPAGSFPVDGLSAAQVTVHAVDPGLLAGQQRLVSMDFEAPSNGYDDDTLTRFDVTNLGTAENGLDIARVEAWADDGDGVFSAAADTPLGEMTFTGQRWERTGISVPLPAPDGARLFVTTDIAELATAGATVLLAIPGPPDFGLGVLSSNDGPVNTAVVSTQQTISTVDRVSLTPLSVPSADVEPGTTDHMILHLVAENSYSVMKTLTGLTLDNVTTGSGAPADLDGEFDQVELWLDDGNGVFDGAPIDKSASAFFDGGQAIFSGLSAWNLPPGETRDLWATADVSVSAADGDVMGVRIGSQANITFLDPTSLAAGFPLDSGGRLTVDGMVAAQIANHGAPGHTLGPSEGPSLALDLGIPSNGYATDMLTGLTVTNLGTAVSADLSDVRLWRDGGDGSFDAGGGDDTDLGAMAFVAGRWVLPGLTETLASGQTRFFVTVIASASPTDGATVRLAVPVDGITVQSGNDGPMDAAVSNPTALLLSTAVLLADLSITPAASTIDSTVTVTMDVRNLHATATIDSITPSALSPSGLGAMQLLSGPSPAMHSLAASGQGTFTWTYRAASSGTVQLSGSVNGVEQGAGTPHQSLTVTSNVHQIFVSAQDLDVFAVQSMPFSINRSQQGVVPLSLTFANPGGVSGSDILLTGLRIRLENEQGQTIVPADLLSRVVVNEGAVVYLDKTALETTATEMDLTLAQPVLIENAGPSSSATLAIALDISDATTVPNFRLAMDDAGAFDAEDATSGAPVNISLVDPTVFPITSGLARIVADATELDVAATPDSASSVGQGQTGVPALRLELTNPDPSGLAADVRVTTFDVKLAGSGGAIANPSHCIDRIRVVGTAQTHLDRQVTAADDSTIALTLSTLVSVPSGIAALPLSILVDFADDAYLGQMHLELADSSLFDARDANTGAPLPVVYAVEPLTGPTLTVQAPAQTAQVAAAALLPASVPVGSADVPALRLTLTHPGPAESGPIRLDTIRLECRDGSGAGLVPATFLDAVRATVAGVTYGEVTSPPASGDEVDIPVTGIEIAPFGQVTLEVSADLLVTAPATLVSMILTADGVDLVDANLGLPVAAMAASGVEFPFTSGFAQLRSPARDLVVGMTGAMPAVLAADGATIEVARVTLRNPAAATAGDILLDRFEVRAADDDLAGIALGAMVTSVQAFVADTLWAELALDVSDEAALLVAADTLAIPPGEDREVAFRVTLPDVETTGGFRLGFEAAGIGVVQPASQLLTVSVLAEDGSSFPLWTEAGHYSGVTLADSYSNFPNPFAAGRGETRLAFYLRDGATVSLKVYTIRGEIVKTLLDGVPLGAGLHQDTTWDGRNGRGHTVVNGVYLAEIAVSFDDGGSERILRKIAVVR